MAAATPVSLGILLLVACSSPGGQRAGDAAAVANLQNQARRALELNQPDLAVQSLVAATQQRPEDADLWNDLGLAQEAAGDWQAAVRSYERAIGIQPKAWRPHLNLAVVCMRHGISGRAQSEFELTDHYRRRNTAGRAAEMLAAEIQAQADTNQDLKAEICRCMEALNPTLRNDYAVILKEVDLKERDLQEVASELGITTNNATVRLHRGRQALKKQLEKSCGTCADHGCLNCSCDNASGCGR
jgi:tetratricopeptide (TPR) repeat protein